MKTQESVSPNIRWHHATVTRRRREEQNGHRGAIVWFTGFSGSGKSTLAHAVEEALCQFGCRTFVLDGDNVRHGLCGDLGFSAKDRIENIRRVGETSKLFMEAGVIALTAFIPTRSHYLDLVHIASSWARAYGGDFIHTSGKQVLFNTPHARRGLMEFFELYRFIPASLRGLDYDACLAEFFQKGNAAVMIAGAESYSDAVANNSLPKDLEDQIGVATVPGISWIGGDHLVVWKTVRTDPQKDQAAVDLVRSLASVENQVRLHRETTILPSRLEAYARLDFHPGDMNAVLEKILQTARPHPPIRLWRRIQSMLTDMLGDIAHSVLEFQSQSVTEIVEAKLADYETRFSLILGKWNKSEYATNQLSHLQ